MPHVALVPLTGLRVREAELLELGMSLPGLRRRAAALAELPALGLLTLAALTPPHWTISYHDGAAATSSDAADGGSASEALVEQRVEQLVERIAATQPTLVALSALTASVEAAYRLAAALRRRGLRVALGGLHATTCSDEAARHVDAVVIGEGEPVWATLLADAAANRLRPTYRATTAFDLAHAPTPRWDLLGDRPRPRFTMQTERGCPLACDFCGASRLLGGFREKPLERIRAELDALAAHTPPHHSDHPWLELADDNTFAGSRDPEPLFELFQQRGVRYFTESDWRLGQRPELLRGLAASGCQQVLVGIESLVFRYRGMGAKWNELEQMLDSVWAIQEAGVAVNGCFIVGADGETRESLDALTQFLLDSPFAEIQVTLQTPFPGTALYHRLEKAGRLLPESSWSSYTLFDVTFQPDRMEVAELRRGFRELLAAVFGAGPSARRAAIRRQLIRYRPIRHEPLRHRIPRFD